MKMYCDGSRHLVCIPYSVENLHKMAKEIKLGKWWYHKSKNELNHYDIPKRRIKEITAMCVVVSSREIIKIIKGEANIKI